MTPTVVAGLLIAVAYLIGAIPFGYIIGLTRGVNLMKVGSGNIGATNAGRMLGKKFGMLVFVLDFLKGAIPVAVIVPLATMLNPETIPQGALKVGAAAAAFLGHLFPVYLGFRGGKGVATGAGTIMVLTPGPALVTVLTWLAVTSATRYISLASILGAIALIVSHLCFTRDSFNYPNVIITSFTIIGALLVIIRHLSNIKRLVAGTETPLAGGVKLDALLKIIHIVALGFWFGSAAFFNFVAALPIFASFQEVVHNSPSDRTAYVNIVPEGTSDDKRKDLGNALAGSAVGPLFPRYFAISGVCAWLVLLTSTAWRKSRVARIRIWLSALAFVLVLFAWPVSQYVSELRTLRFSPNAETAKGAKDSFFLWHTVSLLTSALITTLAGILLALSAFVSSPSDSDRKLEN